MYNKNRTDYYVKGGKFYKNYYKTFNYINELHTFVSFYKCKMCFITIN